MAFPSHYELIQIFDDVLAIPFSLQIDRNCDLVVLQSCDENFVQRSPFFCFILYQKASLSLMVSLVHSYNLDSILAYSRILGKRLAYA